METQQLVMGIIRFLHDLFTVVWIGGLAFMVLTAIPTLKKGMGQGQEAQRMINMIVRRHRVWVYISIFGLFLTGLLLGRSSGEFKGLLHFDNLYSSLTAIKHILTFAMVFLALFRSVHFGREDKKLTPRQNKASMIMIFVNFIFGIAILLLSGLIASI